MTSFNTSILNHFLCQRLMKKFWTNNIMKINQEIITKMLKYMKLMFRL